MQLIVLHGLPDHRVLKRVECLGLDLAALFQKALAWQRLQLEGDEVECIVANLIAQGYVKGYISHKMQVCLVA